MQPEKATSVRRAVDLLLALGGEEALRSGGLGVKRLSELLGEDKTRVSRTLQTLAEYSLVERDPETRAYRIGWSIYTLAARAGEARLLAAAPASLAALRDELHESAHLSVLAGRQVETVISHASPQALAATSWVGRQVPAHCTSAGRALLFDHDLAALQRLFGPGCLPAAGPRAPRTVAELLARIDGARAAGYAVAVDESEPGLAAAAAPVRDHRGRIVAAVNVSAPAFRFRAELHRAGDAVVRAAAELSLAIGARPLELDEPIEVR
ncbi:MAG: IclR family transcriptional regulator [Solirubrobacterales bacterium]|nr:IclR family transcriptional regulator [Solirubrobacterales bacterium]